MITLLLACSDDPRHQGKPVDTGVVVTTGDGGRVEVSARGSAGNVWRLRAEGFASGTELVLAGDGDTRRFALGDPLDVEVLGLLPDTRYTASAGDVHATFDTSHPDPARCPQVDVLAHDPVRMAPGWTMVPFLTRIFADSCTILYDGELRPRWWYLPAEGEMRVEDVVLGPDDRLWMRGQGVEVRRWDGELVAAYVADPTGPLAHPLPTDSVHHELLPQPDGSFWTFGRTCVRGVVPTADGADTTVETDVNDTPIFHVAADGSILRQIDLLPLLQPGRAGFDGLNLRYPDCGADYVHANALEVLPDGRVVVSLRNQDVVLMLDADGAVQWRMGDPGGWEPPWADELLEPVGAITWPYHQHGVDYDPVTGELVVFDNHAYGGTPYGADPADSTSRASVYRVDEVARTVELVASADRSATGLLRAEIMGDADRTSTGTLLASFGWMEGEGGVPNRLAGRGDVHARVVELDPDGGPPALDLRLWLDRAPGFRGGYVYRVERLPPLAP